MPTSHDPPPNLTSRNSLSLIRIKRSVAQKRTKKQSKVLLQVPTAASPTTTKKMASGGVVKHILLARFKEDVTQERLDELIRGYAALVAAVPSMKAFHW